MIKVYRHENKIHETVLRLQRETLVSEEQLVEEFRRLCQKIYKIREESALGVDQGLENIMRTFDNIKMDSDWHNFAQQHNEQLVSENAAFRHPDQLQYPNHSHALLQPIFAAHMERRSNLLHEWKENIYVLTPAGFLHEYKDNGRNYPSKPDNTLFIPHYKVSSLSTNLHHNLVFQLQPHASSRNMLHSQGHTTFIPKQWRSSKQRWGVVHDRWTWTLRAKSAADMELWVRYLTNTSERYGVCSFDYTNKYIPTIPEEAVKVVEEEVVEVKEEAVEIKEEAVEIKEEAVEIKEEAVEIKEEEVMKEEEVIKEEAVEAGDSTNEVVGAVKEEIIEEVVTKIDVTMDTAVIE
ncbi:hypothetical protein BDB01DRAFT_368331 [Pilobolus umbonatus]|nr:hypothetical protein BDB01DRAFT_368331 [Pilobolus umbonatus]